ncbi:MAG: hypothetical protein FWD83_07610 [Promicromonosporaceae bacterium]|nr:hypothetical protein [Promicromonosporaceae bacterium]
MNHQPAGRRTFVIATVATLLLAGAALPAYAYWQTAMSGSATLTAGTVPPITITTYPGTVTSASTASDAYVAGICGTANTAAGLPNADASGATYVPISLHWNPDTTGIVQSYLVTMTITSASSDSLVSNNGSLSQYDLWSGNDRPSVYNYGSFPAPNGTTYLGPTVKTDANAANFTPQGMVTVSTTETSTVTPAANYGSNAPRSSGASTTWSIPAQITYAGGTSVENTPRTIAAQNGNQTIGVQWAYALPLGWTTVTTGTTTVIAVGPGGWQSTPVTVYWRISYGSGNSMYCSTQSISGVTS